jgi:hypothetical protein
MSHNRTMTFMDTNNYYWENCRSTIAICESKNEPLGLLLGRQLHVVSDGRDRSPICEAEESADDDSLITIGFMTSKFLQRMLPEMSVRRPVV